MSQLLYPFFLNACFRCCISSCRLSSQVVCARWIRVEGTTLFVTRLYSESACRYNSVCVVFCIHCGIPTWYTETVHSLSNPGRTEVYVLDSSVSSHQLHPTESVPEMEYFHTLTWPSAQEDCFEVT